MSSKNLTTVVYRSLEQIWTTLAPHRQTSPEVRSVMNLCVDLGMVDSDGKLQGLEKSMGDGQTKPFIVIEGLDGTGKTTLTKHLSKMLNMKLLCTPPKHPVTICVRPYFDEQDESLRRAFYSLCNYLAASDVIKSDCPVVMDRFWHSTAAYAMAHQMKDGGQAPKSQDLMWPSDLLQPDLIIFLQVSEQERVRRHTLRKDFTNTEEEKTLAADTIFRKNLVDCYRMVTGPGFLELNVDGEQPTVEAKIVETVLQHFPHLKLLVPEQLQEQKQNA